MGETRLLLTGFTPFGRFAVNPSWEAVRAVAERLGSGVVAARLPVDYEAARAELYALLNLHRPAACLCTGLTPEQAFCLEGGARKPVQFASAPGEGRLAGQWPWGQVEGTLSRMGAAWRRSDDAGAYVCESTYWALLDHPERLGYPRTAGFLHVPCASEEYPILRTTACVEAVVGDYLASIAPAGA